jgi:hypothetical protein
LLLWFPMFDLRRRRGVFTVPYRARPALVMSGSQ